MQLIISDIETKEWVADNYPDSMRSDEKMLRNRSVLRLGRKLYFRTFVKIDAPNKLRHVLSKVENIIDPGLTCISGQELLGKGGGFTMTGAFTPHEHEGNKYAQFLLRLIVEQEGKVFGDTQNTRSGKVLMDKVGKLNHIDYFQPHVVSQESYLYLMKHGKLSDVEKELLRTKAFEIALLEIKK